MQKTNKRHIKNRYINMKFDMTKSNFDRKWKMRIEYLSKTTSKTSSKTKSAHIVLKDAHIEMENAHIEMKDALTDNLLKDYHYVHLRLKIFDLNFSISMSKMSRRNSIQFTVDKIRSFQGSHVNQISRFEDSRNR